MQNDATSLRPYVLIGAGMTGVVAVWQLVAGAVLAQSTRRAAPDGSLSETDPRRVGPYRIVGLLGTGAMGRAYLGKSKRGEYVAVKVVRPEFAESAEFRRRFAREVTSIRQVSSPYTLRLLDADPAAARPWLATPYVAGPTLQQAVENSGPWASESVWRLAAGIAEALQAIHSAGIIHRDLKPANILLALDGPRVIDFGIARAADASTLTATTNRPGTPAFMAPEQVLGGPIGPATDIFALGVALAYAATGRIAFGEGTSDAILFRVVHHSPDLSGLDGDLADLVRRCLDKHPANRPTAAEIIARSHTRTNPVPQQNWLPAPVATQITSGEGRGSSAHSSGRRPVLAIAAVVALVVSLASLGLQIKPTFGEEETHAGGPTPTPSQSPPAPSPSPSRPSPSPVQPTKSTPPPVVQVRIPKIIGRTLDEATKLLADAGLKLGSSTSQANTTVPVGQVFTTDPAEDALVAKGSTVKVTVSAGAVPEVMGTVVDTSGRPIPGALVALRDQGSPARTFTARTDGAGRFRFASTGSGVITPGPLIISAEKDGYKSSPKSFTVPAGRALVATPITVPVPIIG